MHFFGIIGDMGSGKTNFATAMLYLSYLQGRKVGANYALKFPAELIPFSEVAEFSDKIQDIDLCMDELGVGADSYDFFASQPRQIGKLVTQVRKRNSRLYYTVQRFSMIARRLRIMTDGFFAMEDLDRNADHTVPGYVCNGLFRVRFLDNELQQTRKSEVFDGKPFRDLYNSKEIVWD